MQHSVLFVLNSATVGGAERWVSRAVSLVGVSAAIALPSSSPLYETHALDCPRLELNIGPKLSRRSAFEFLTSGWKHYRALVRLLSDARDTLGTETVHFQFKKEQILGSFAARRLGLRVVWTEHAPLPLMVKRTPLRPLYAAAARLTDAIIVPTDATRRSLLGVGVPGDRLRVVPNALGDEWFEPRSPASRETVRAEFGFSQSDIVVAKVCSVSRDRGHDKLVRAAKVLRKRRSRVRFLFVGDGPLLPAVRRMIASEGLEGTIVVAGHRTDVQAILDASDAFVNASTAQGEGLPYRVIEAMARRLPIVTSSFDGLREFMQPGHSCLCITSADPGAWAEALLQLEADERLAERLATAAFESASHRFRESVTSAAIREIFGAPRTRPVRRSA